MQGQQRNAWICTQSKKASHGRRGFDEPWADELKKFRMQHADATDGIDAIVGRSLLNLRPLFIRSPIRQQELSSNSG
jgi:hypothetical protein